MLSVLHCISLVIRMHYLFFIGVFRTYKDIFYNCPLFKRLASFNMTINRNLEHFLTFGFRIIFLKTRIFFQKTRVPFLNSKYSNLHRTNFIKTDHTKVNVKKNKLWSTKLPYNKECCFTIKCLVFMKIK